MDGGAIEQFLSYANGTFLFDQPLKGGSSKKPLSAHLRQAAKTMGVDPEELLQTHLKGQNGTKDTTVDECPEGFEWYLPAFFEATRGRGSNGYSPDSLTWTELFAWMTVNRLELSPWETDLLMALDATWRTAWNGSVSGT